MKKPLHKHIGQQAKKVGSHFTKYLYERDTIFATVWVFIFIVALSSIPLNLGVMNPVKLGLKDFDFNDLSYSKLEKSSTTPIDNRIVVINIGQADREGIAMLIEKTATLKPKVMALDVLFYEAKDPYKDSLLNEAFSKNRNLIAAQKLVPTGKEGDTFHFAGTFFKTAATYAHVNFFNEETSTIRYFEPFQKDYAGKMYASFPTEIVKAFDKTAYESLEKKGAGKVIINYSRRTNQYLVIDGGDLLMDNVDPSAIEGKIALLAYVNTNRNDIEDKKFTPMNEKFAGKSIPDMNGIIVHANIISMALDKNYIKKVPLWLTVLIAIFVCWLHMSFFIRYYLESHIWFHLVAKILQVASAIFFVWLGIYLFDRYRLKVDLKLSLITIIMAVDVIYFYEAWAVWMHKKFHYRTIFKPHHH